MTSMQNVGAESWNTPPQGCFRSETLDVQLPDPLTRMANDPDPTLREGLMDRADILRKVSVQPHIYDGSNMALDRIGNGF